MKVFALLAAFFVPATALADTPQLDCRPAADMLERLAHDYAEGVLSSGRAAGDQFVVITVNPQTGTWSLLVVRPDGVACLAASGTDWRMLPQGEPA